MFTEQFIEHQGHRLNLAAGPATGPPLLFLHGVCRLWRDFVPLFPTVLPRWRVLALDFRGHGRSDRHPDTYRVKDYAEDVAAVLQSPFVIEPAVIFGHSLGALAAMATAAKMPERVRAIVLEDPPSAELLRNIRTTPFFAQFSAIQLMAGDTAPIPELARHLGAIPLPGPGNSTMRLGDLRDATILRFGARCVKDLDPDVLSPLVAGRWLDGLDIDVIVRNVKCPALILRGEEPRGGMLGRVEAARWAAAMTDATLIDVPGVGHLIHWLATETTTRLLLGFLESLR